MFDQYIQLRHGGLSHEQACETLDLGPAAKRLLERFVRRYVAVNQDSYLACADAEAVREQAASEVTQKIRLA